MGLNPVGSYETKLQRMGIFMAKPQAVPTLKQIAGLHQARVPHHRVHGSDTGSNSGGRRIPKKN